MEKYTKQQAIKVVTECAAKYCAELLDRNLLFIIADKHKRTTAVEVSFFDRNYLHLTGLNVDRSTMSSNSFLAKCRDKKLSPDDFEFKPDGTTGMKLDVLPLIMTKNLSANMVGDYNNYGLELYTEKIAGSVKGCIGFRIDDITNLLVPNTVLNYDIRKCTRDTRGQVIATFRKEKDDNKYSEIVYKAKKLDWSRIKFPEKYTYLFELVQPKDDIKNANDKKYNRGEALIMTKIERVCKFLKDAETYYLATVEGDQPRVRPFGTAHIFEGKLYIQTGKVKDVSKQLMANGKAEICAFMKGEWIRIAGTLVEDDRIEARQSMLDAYPGLQKMYKADDGNTQVFYFKNAVATISAFTHEPEVIKF